MNNPKVLLVDDEREITDALQRDLRLWCRTNSVVVQVAFSAADALALLRETGDVAVVISDLQMPGLKGSDFLGLVASLYPGVVTMVLTGNAEADTARGFLDAGVHCFLRKPWDRDVLVTELGRALQVWKERSTASGAGLLPVSVEHNIAAEENLALDVRPRSVGTGVPASKTVAVPH